MASKHPAVLSFDDTEEDNIDGSVAEPVAAPVAPKGKDPKRTTPVLDGGGGSLTKMSVFSKRSDESVKTTAHAAPTPVSSASSTAARLPGMPVTKSPSMTSVNKEEKNRMSWSKISSIVGIKKTEKKPEIKGKLVISGPSNFTHVKTITSSTEPAATTPRMTKSESFNSIHDQLPMSPSKDTVDSSIGSIPEEEHSPATSEMEIRKAAPNDATSTFNKKTIDDLLTGAYFLKHTKGNEPRQAFISCSDDLLQLHVWGNYYDKSDKKVPRETVHVGEVTEIKTGFATSAFEQTGIPGREQLAFSLVLGGSRSVDLEAFTPADRAVWIARFNSLLDFLKVS